MTIKEHYQHHNSIIVDSYNFDLSNEMFLIIGCLSSIFTNISDIYLTKRISPQKFDKFWGNVQYVTTKPVIRIILTKTNWQKWCCNSVKSLAPGMGASLFLRVRSQFWIKKSQKILKNCLKAYWTTFSLKVLSTLNFLAYFFSLKLQNKNSASRNCYNKNC